MKFAQPRSRNKLNRAIVLLQENEALTAEGMAARLFIQMDQARRYIRAAFPIIAQPKRLRVVAEMIAAGHAERDEVCDRLEVVDIVARRYLKLAKRNLKK